MKAAAVLVGCLVALASTETTTEPPQRTEIIKWIMNIIKFDTDMPLSTTNTPPRENCPTCKCGVARKKVRIVGGFETMVLEFPWMAMLMFKGRFYCGGSVINDLYVLTAAHCVADRTKEELSVRLLEHDLSGANETKPVIRKVAAIIKNSQYNPYPFPDNDIALLKLDERVDLSKAMNRSNNSFEHSMNNSHKAEDLPGVRSVCLPPEDLTFDKSKGMVIGWGATSEGGPSSDKLLQVNVPIMSNDDCQKTVYGKVITENMMCAGEPEGLHDACQGDSGGPLHVLNATTDTHMQVGVVSWGFGCARPNNPGVYTRVNRYLNWIKNNTEDACYCS